MTRQIENAKAAGPAAARQNSVATYPSTTINGQAILEKARPKIVDRPAMRKHCAAVNGPDSNKKERR